MDLKSYYYNYFQHRKTQNFIKEYIDLLRRYYSLSEDVPVYSRMSIREKDPSVKRLLLENGLSQNDEFMVLAPESNGEKRWYPPENFARIADELREKFHLKIVIVGTLKGLSIALRIKSLMQNEPVILTAKTNLSQLVNIIARAVLTVSIDTSIWHISQALSVPTVSITNRNLAEDYPVDSSICKIVRLNESLECSPPCFTKCLFSDDYSLCFKLIKSKEVIGVCEELLRVKPI